jgi:two-component system cell cycle sensor histidine kinase/response regulator CckA
MAAPETILLAEDDGCVRGIAARTLLHIGYSVLEAAHGAQAFEIGVTYNGPIHLLVTDLVMPYMSGRALAELLRRGRPALRVLYVSGYAAEIPPEMTLEPCADFLAKPYLPSVLARHVRELLDRRVEGEPADSLAVSG